MTAISAKAVAAAGGGGGREMEGLRAEKERLEAAVRAQALDLGRLRAALTGSACGG